MEITVQKKLLNLQADLESLKFLVRNKTDMLIDRVNWQKVRPVLKKNRRKIYQDRYGR